MTALKLRLIARNRNDLEKIIQRVAVINIQYGQFKLDTLFRLAEEIVLTTIHSAMRRASYSEKIILGTIVTQVQILTPKKARIFFRSHYISETGFDVALAREKGTKDHDLPKVDGRTYHWKQDGKSAFSKGHRVKGIFQSNIMRDVTREQSEFLAIEFEKAKTEWLEENFQGLAEIG